MSKQYTTNGKKALIFALKKSLGDINVQDSTKYGDSSSDYKISYEAILQYFKDDESNIKNYSWSTRSMVISMNLLNSC